MLGELPVGTSYSADGHEFNANDFCTVFIQGASHVKHTCRKTHVLLIRYCDQSLRGLVPFWGASSELSKSEFPGTF